MSQSTVGGLAFESSDKIGTEDSQEGRRLAVSSVVIVSRRTVLQLERQLSVKTYSSGIHVTPLDSRFGAITEINLPFKEGRSALSKGPEAKKAYKDDRTSILCSPMLQLKCELH